ncbi:NAD(P)/FAD-dependent oxidoreductase [Nakamurella endophytica]|uniref:FAD-dependent oxidoreductase n=1 Tax=Nakamurella endophytica TaxID=1748367 RepID=A0A917TAM7_9ACTN|nr:FAD-binding oxidoreductase [Nakamurella endophytica]GGM16490.1 FAD-dependent oxidoreductase [Nakamurella endophytica]
MSPVPPSWPYRGLSLWLDRFPGSLARRSPLPGDRSFDVAVVGAGFTGLWTAFHLRRADPSIRVAVLEAETAGFGASGRNGGWCSDLFPASWERIARRHGRPAALAMKAAMRQSIDAVADTVAAEAIDCGWVRGGTVAFARSATQWQRAQDEVAHAYAWGDTEDDVRLLDRRATAEVAGVAGALGASFTRHCAAVDPGALVRGLADAVERAGVAVFEGTRVRRIEPGRVLTDRGTVTADVVVRATEAYTAGLEGSHRDLAPVYSLIVATEPLDAATLDAVGLATRPTFTDHRHLISYGQRTADGRIVFGGRGAPYHAGSRIRPDFDRDPGVFDRLRRTVVDLFPALAGARFTHAWGGALGIPRDWHAGVGLDRRTGLAWAGGYVGDGVATANLAGRTLADLVTGRDTELTRLPWVGHRSRRWEPEPLRWLGINAGLRAMATADRREERTGRASRVAEVVQRVVGG